MAYLHELLIVGLPEVPGGRLIIGSSKPCRRAKWPEGEYIVNESGHLLDCGFYKNGRPRRAREWRPYTIDILADDWEPFAAPSDGSVGGSAHD